MIVRVTGGLGNQMFQYAFYRALKYRFPESEILLDKSFYTHNEVHNGFELTRIFGINDVSDLSSNIYSSRLQENIIRVLKKLPLKMIKTRRYMIENGVYFFKDILETVKSNTVFDGYWQSEEYFINIKQDLLNIFTFSGNDSERNNELKESLKNYNSVSLHVRRGDYLSTSRYNNLWASDYYIEAMKKIEESVESPVYIVFSDDINWCKQKLFPDSSKKVLFIDWNTSMDSFRDMELMSHCKHNIIANSSFSWWGAWLNRNQDKIVIAPKKFFKDCNYDETHLIPNSWIKIGN